MVSSGECNQKASLIAKRSRFSLEMVSVSGAWTRDADSDMNVPRIFLLHFYPQSHCSQSFLVLMRKPKANLAKIEDPSTGTRTEEQFSATVSMEMKDCLALLVMGIGSSTIFQRILRRLKVCAKIISQGRHILVVSTSWKTLQVVGW